MAITINGSSGISGVDGTAGTPALQGSDSNTGISFGTDTVNINTDGTTRATVDSSGRLLVGTSTARSVPGWAPGLQIEGTSFTSSSFSLMNNSTDANPAFITFGKSRGGALNSNTTVNNGDYLGQIAFYGADGTGTVKAAEINANVDGTPGANDMPGRLVFSTTADGASSPTERMKIFQNGFVATFSSTVSFATATSAAASSTNTLIQGAHSATGPATGTQCFEVKMNGDVKNTNNSYGAISDIKLKENIVDASSQWDDLKAIQVRNYNFKKETGHQTHTQLGVVAQEIELVSPGLVTETPDRDTDGNDLGTTTKSVNYSVLYMKAVKALQEAMERIETLEAKVAALEGGAAQ